MSSRVNLAPATTRKECSAYDLPFTIGILLTTVTIKLPIYGEPGVGVGIGVQVNTGVWVHKGVVVGSNGIE